MRRTVKYRCGADLGHGRTCKNPVARKGARCHLPGHGKGLSGRALRKAAAGSWNASSHRAAPASKPGRRAEQGKLRAILDGLLRFQWMSPKARAKYGKQMAPTAAVAREIPHDRNSRGRGSNRPRQRHSKIYRRLLSREN